MKRSNKLGVGITLGVLAAVLGYITYKVVQIGNYDLDDFDDFDSDFDTDGDEGEDEDIFEEFD